MTNKEIQNILNRKEYLACVLFSRLGVNLVKAINETKEHIVNINGVNITHIIDLESKGIIYNFITLYKDFKHIYEMYTKKSIKGVIYDKYIFKVNSECNYDYDTLEEGNYIYYTLTVNTLLNHYNDKEYIDILELYVLLKEEVERIEKKYDINIIEFIEKNTENENDNMSKQQSKKITNLELDKLLNIFISKDYINWLEELKNYILNSDNRVVLNESKDLNYQNIAILLTLLKLYIRNNRIPLCCYNGDVIKITNFYIKLDNNYLKFDDISIYNIDTYEFDKEISISKCDNIKERTFIDIKVLFEYAIEFLNEMDNINTSRKLCIQN